MADVFEVAETVVSQWVKAHGEKIGIIAYYGSYAQGTATAKSDLDLFYIPDDPGMWRWDSWVLDDVPFEIWSISWPFAEEIVSGKSRWPVGPSIISHARVLYSRSPEDLARFEALQGRIKDLIKPENRKRLLELAFTEYKSLLGHLGNLRLSERSEDPYAAVISGRNLASSAISCIAYANQRYLDKSWESSMDGVLALPKKPGNLADCLAAIGTTPDIRKLTEVAETLAISTREFLISEQRSLTSTPNAKDAMTDFYNVIHEFANKIISRCDKADPYSANLTSSVIQEDLASALAKAFGAHVDTGFNLYGEYGGVYAGLGFPDLMGAAISDDLYALKERAVELKGKAKEWLTANGIETNEVASLEELAGFLGKSHSV